MAPEFRSETMATPCKRHAHARQTRARPQPRACGDVGQLISRNSDVILPPSGLPINKSTDAASAANGRRGEHWRRSWKVGRGKVQKDGWVGSRWGGRAGHLLSSASGHESCTVALLHCCLLEKHNSAQSLGSWLDTLTPFFAASNACCSLHGSFPVAHRPSGPVHSQVPHSQIRRWQGPQGGLQAPREGPSQEPGRGPLVVSVILHQHANG